MRNNLWAPWRIRYILSGNKKGCFLCKTESSSKKFILYKGKYAFVILNIFPYNNGHLMIAPYRHIKEIEKLNEDEEKEIFSCIKISLKILKKILKPDGFNIGINIGKCAGAGLPGHLHFHIVPRWEGDTNFMPVIGNTKIISQSISELYKILKKEFSSSK